MSISDRIRATLTSETGRVRLRNVIAVLTFIPAVCQALPGDGGTATGMTPHRRILLASTAPELRVANLSLSRGVAHLNEKVEAVVIIENTGTMGATQVAVRFSLGKRQLGRDYLIDIPARSKVEVSTLFEARPEGKLEFRVSVDPDDRIAENNKKNNVGKRTLGILSLPRALYKAPAGSARGEIGAAQESGSRARDNIAPPNTGLDRKRRKTDHTTKRAAGTLQTDAKTTGRPKPPRPAKITPNLIGTVETIEGIHYFRGPTLQVKMTNVGKRSTPSKLGIRKQGRKNKKWLVTLPIKGLKTGETLTVDLPLMGYIDDPGDTRYIVEVDIENDVDEGKQGEQDNASEPFQLVALDRQFAPPPASLSITSPPPGSVLRSGGTYAVRWRRRGSIKGPLLISLADRGGKTRVVAANVPNNGRHDWRVPILVNGRYWLIIQTGDGTIQTRGGPYQIKSPKRTKIKMISPGRGAELYVGKTHTIRWSATKTGNPGPKLRINLVEQGDVQKQWPLSNVGIPIGTGRFDWTVPSTPTFFGRYFLRLTDSLKRTVARSEPFEIKPRFVPSSFHPTGEKPANSLKADLAITSAGFTGQYFGFTVKNRGPDTIPLHALLGIRFRTYYVNSVPIKTQDDYEICDHSLFDIFPPQQERHIRLGSDPECGHGLLSDDEKFVFAVIRIELPPLADLGLEDPDLMNNVLKVRYPKKVN